jgi:hypothetical protein
MAALTSVRALALALIVAALLAWFIAPRCKEGERGIVSGSLAACR